MIGSNDFKEHEFCAVCDAHDAVHLGVCGQCGAKGAGVVTRICRRKFGWFSTIGWEGPHEARND